MGAVQRICSPSVYTVLVEAGVQHLYLQTTQWTLSPPRVRLTDGCTGTAIHLVNVAKIEYKNERKYTEA